MLYRDVKYVTRFESIKFLVIKTLKAVEVIIICCFIYFLYKIFDVVTEFLRARS